METTTQNTALLIMDMQTGILGSLPDTKTLVGNVKKAIAAARSRQIPVLFVVVSFRPGAPEINMNNKGFAAARERFANINMDKFMQVEPALGRLPDELVIFKRRVSAFTGSDLEVILRAKGIQHIILTGVATSGVVLSTTREAADKDYRITILADCCADGDDEVHRVLTTKVFARQADVMTVDEWIKL